MTAANLIRAVEANGGHFRVDGERVSIIPRAAAEPLARELIRNKAKLLLLLRERETTPAAGGSPPERNLAILYEYESGNTLQQVGNKYNVSRQRVQQIVRKWKPMRDRQREQREMHFGYIKDFLEITEQQVSSEGERPVS